MFPSSNLPFPKDNVTGWKGRQLSFNDLHCSGELITGNSSVFSFVGAFSDEGNATKGSCGGDPFAHDIVGVRGVVSTSTTKQGNSLGSFS